MSGRCNTADNDCDVDTNCECFVCCDPVCKTCSMVVNYLHYGRKRLCRACLAERKDDIRLNSVEQAMAELAKIGVCVQTDHLEPMKKIMLAYDRGQRKERGAMT